MKYFKSNVLNSLTFPLSIDGLSKIDSVYKSKSYGECVWKHFRSVFLDAYLEEVVRSLEITKKSRESY